MILRSFGIWQRLMKGCRGIAGFAVRAHYATTGGNAGIQHSLHHGPLIKMIG
jgi:hypothetical protein